MREVSFIRQNQDRWQQLETMLSNTEQINAAELAKAYVQLMDDLAFARAQFPQSQSALYLNTLASQIHVAVARNKRMRWEKLRHLIGYEIPLAFSQIRPHLAIAAAVFITFAAIGYISALRDEQFIQSVLGYGYVDMTVANIKQGTPLDVYNQDGALMMFLQIALNNILILLRSVGLGLLPVVGAAYLLVPNGVMVGTFMGLFARYGELATATLGIWIHGTLEISAIVVGCAAAIRISEVVLHPGTYPRRQAFIRGMRTAILVTVGMVPLLVVAALIESFVTRYYAVSPLLNLSIIVASLAFVIWYIVVWPSQLLKRTQRGK